MGIISKIEDKLSGHHGEEKKLEKQAVKQEAHEHNSGSSGLNPSNRDPYRNPISSQSASGAPHIPGQSSHGGMGGIGGMGGAAAGAGAMSGAGGLGDERQRLSTDARQAVGGHSSHPSSRTAENEFRDNDGYGSQGAGYDSTRGPRQPMDPYSSKGQSAAASAANPSRAQEQGYGGGRSSMEDPNVPRSRMGGIRNSVDEPSRRENHDAIPTAGGQKLGTGAGSDPYEGRQQQHHYGRDAAAAGGLGAAGVGAYEFEKGHRGDDGHRHADDGPFEAARHRDDTGPASKTIGPHSNNLMNVVDPRVKPNAAQQGSRDNSGAYGSDPSSRVENRMGESQPRRSQDQHHYGRDAGIGAAGVGAAGVGAYELDKRHRRHENEYDDRSSGPVGSAYSTDDPSHQGRHHHHQHGHHDRDQYEAGQNAARQSTYEQPSRGNTDNISYMNQNRPAPGTQLDDYSSGRQPQQSGGHHLGRDAALAGGAGVGAGALASHHHHGQEPSSQQGYGQQLQDPSYGGMPSSTSSPQQQQMPQQSQPQQSQQQGSLPAGGLSSAIPDGGKLGGAYEAGYRDALAHMEAQMKKQQL